MAYGFRVTGWPDAGGAGGEPAPRPRDRAGPEPALPVRHLGLHDQRPVLLLEGRTQAGHAPGMLYGVPFRMHPDLLPDPDRGGAPVRDRYPQPKRVDPDGRGHGR